MIDAVLSSVATWIVNVISSSGYLGVLGLMAIESACIPLPSEVIMPFAGYLVSIGRFNLLAAATMGALGCNRGSTVAYSVAAQGGRKAMERWGAYILVRRAELDRTEDRAVLRPLRRGNGVHRTPAAGGADIHRISSGPCANADAEIPNLHVPRHCHVAGLVGGYLRP
jgi:hypothetical protein